jgi:hypothetical protein
VVLVILYPDVLSFILLPVTGGTVLRAVVEKGNRMVSVDIVSQQMGPDE